MRAKLCAAVMLSIPFVFAPGVVQTRSHTFDDDHQRRFELVSISNDWRAGRQRQRPRRDQRRRTLRGVCVDRREPGAQRHQLLVRRLRARSQDRHDRARQRRAARRRGRREQRLAGRARQRRHQPRRALRRVRLGSLELRARRHPRHAGRVRARPAGRTRPSSSAAASTGFPRADRTRRRSAATAASWRSARSRIASCPTATRTSPTTPTWSIG